jgi:glycosyltransferase involved in cell wall biosynthesis
VAPTGGALPEVVGNDGETGLLVAPNDPGALAAAIGRLLDDPELRARLGAAGRERVLTRFTWAVTAKGTAACYEAMMAGRPLPGAPLPGAPLPGAPAAEVAPC